MEHSKEKNTESGMDTTVSTWLEGYISIHPIELGSY